MWGRHCTERTDKPYLGFTDAAAAAAALNYNSNGIIAGSPQVSSAAADEAAWAGGDDASADAGCIRAHKSLINYATRRKKITLQNQRSLISMSCRAQVHIYFLRLPCALVLPCVGGSRKLCSPALPTKKTFIIALIHVTMGPQLVFLS